MKYGDKLSSALDVNYRDGSPYRISGMVGVSSIYANLVLEGPLRKNVAWILGMRKVNYSYLFDALQTKGTYTPDFQDIQMGLKWQLNNRNRFKLFGLFGDSQFKLSPEHWSSKSTRTIVTAMDISGNESFDYQTAAVGVHLNSQITEKLDVQIGFSSFNQLEKENTSVEYAMTSTKIDSLIQEPDTSIITIPDKIEIFRTNLTTALHHLCFRFSWNLNHNHEFNFGVEINHYRFDDQFHQEVSELSHFDWIQPYKIHSKDVIHSTGISAYSEYFWHPWSFALLRADLRFTEFDFNKEMLFMPRLNLLFHLAESTDLFLAAGRYTQPPLYKEFRSIGKERQPI